MAKSLDEAVEVFRKRYGAVPKITVYYDPARLDYSVDVTIPAVSQIDGTIDIFGDDNKLTSTLPIIEHPAFKMRLYFSDEFLYSSRTSLSKERDLYRLLLDQPDINYHTGRFFPEDLAEIIAFGVVDQLFGSPSRLSYHSGGIVASKPRPKPYQPIKRKLKSRKDAVSNWLA